jgi:hypothetical protein
VTLFYGKDVDLRGFLAAGPQLTAKSWFTRLLLIVLRSSPAST